jgi:chromosome segregation ATPase
MSKLNSPSQMSKAELRDYAIRLEGRVSWLENAARTESDRFVSLHNMLAERHDLVTDLRKVLKGERECIKKLEIEVDALERRLSGSRKAVNQRTSVIMTLRTTISALNRRVEELKRQRPVTEYQKARDHVTALIRSKGLPTDVEPFKGMITRTAATMSLGKMTYEEVDMTLGEFLERVYGR